jgi:lactoylglutathione lyase
MLSLVVIRSRQMDKLASFYSALGLSFIRHRHDQGPEHFSAKINGTAFEIYPASKPEEDTTSTRLGFSVLSLTNTLNNLRSLDAVILSEPSDIGFGRRAVVKDFKGHKIELYEDDSMAQGALPHSR